MCSKIVLSYFFLLERGCRAVQDQCYRGPCWPTPELHIFPCKCKSKHLQRDVPAHTFTYDLSLLTVIRLMAERMGVCPDFDYYDCTCRLVLNQTVIKLKVHAQTRKQSHNKDLAIQTRSLSHGTFSNGLFTASV